MDNILNDEKSNENISIYDISYKTLIRFEKVNGFVRVYEGTKYLIRFGLGKYDASYNRIIYRIELKSGTTYAFS